MIDWVHVVVSDDDVKVNANLTVQVDVRELVAVQIYLVLRSILRISLFFGSGHR